ncbi:MAG: DUF5818 domain-containing protein [Candidatus Sulfotelmatobacter sp.]
MKKFWLRLSFAAAILAAVAVLPPKAYAQETDNAAVAAPTQHRNEADMPASGAKTTEDIKAFSGNILRDNGELVLEDSATKVTHRLDDETKAKEFLGKRVRVTGKLDANTNTIQVEKIEPSS